MQRLLALALLVGCYYPSRYAYSPASSRQRIPARSDTCRFDVLTTTPKRSFEEIGVLDHINDGAAAPTNIRDYRNSIRVQVCRAGGDAVIAFANGMGEYIKGTVVRYEDEDDAGESGDGAEQTAKPAAAPAAEQDTLNAPSSP